MRVYRLIINSTKVIQLLVVALVIAASAQLTFAQETVVKASFLSQSKQPIPVNVLTGQSCLVLFDQSIGRITLSNTETAEAVVVAPNQMVVNGKTPGRARFVTWDKQDNQFIFLDIDVRANLAQIDAQIQALFPKEDIQLSQANGSVVLSGSVTSTKIAQQAESVVQAAGIKTVNLLETPVTSMTQVQLQIRVAEVSRNKLSEYAFTPVYTPRPGEGGYTNTGQGPWSLGSVDQGSLFGTVAQTLNLFLMSNNFYAFLRALQQNGALRALAEPNLIAMNGQQASFLAGGEFPIPVVQSGAAQGAVSIVYKEYGVRLNFKPTIIDEDHIRLELEPEVSTIDYTNAVRFSGFLIPALRTRRARTGIELQDGQSFGIAGLLDNNEMKALSKIPVVGDVPILGELFKSKSFQKNETELVFMVTAKIVKPLNPDAIPQMRGVDGLKGTSPLGIENSGQNDKDKTGTPSEFKGTTSSSGTQVNVVAPTTTTNLNPDANTNEKKTGATSNIVPVLPAIPSGSATNAFIVKPTVGNGDNKAITPGSNNLAPPAKANSNASTPGANPEAKAKENEVSAPNNSGAANDNIKINDAVTETKGAETKSAETKRKVKGRNGAAGGSGKKSDDPAAVDSDKAKPAPTPAPSLPIKNLVWTIKAPAHALSAQSVARLPEKNKP